MKKFTLLSVLMLFAFVAFAQRNVHPIQMNALPAKANVLKNYQGVDRNTVSNTRKAPLKASELVTPPDGKEAEAWHIAGGAYALVYQGQLRNATSYFESINVLIDGNDIYFQGLTWYFEEGWVKGTINGSTVTIPTGQLVGSEGEDGDYLVGYNITTENLCDIVFAYDSANGTLTLDPNIILVENSTENELLFYGYWQSLILSKEAPELITPPSEGEDYVMENSEAYEWDRDVNDGEGDYVNITNTEDISGLFKVVIEGTDIYIQGIDALYFPEGWIKGTLDGNTATFPTGQFVGADEYGNEFIVGKNTETEDITDIVFSYDSTTGSLTLDPNINILITGNPQSTDEWYYWKSLTLIKATSDENPDAISTINAKQEDGAIYNLQGVKMNKPTQKGVYIHNGRKVIVK